MITDDARRRAVAAVHEYLERFRAGCGHYSAILPSDCDEITEAVIEALRDEPPPSEPPIDGHIPLTAGQLGLCPPDDTVKHRPE